MFWRVLYFWLGFLSLGLGKLNFCQISSWDWFLLLICIGCWPLVAERICIKGDFHDVHALFYIIVHSVHARCLIKCQTPLRHFLACLDFDEYQTLGFFMFPH